MGNVRRRLERLEAAVPDSGPVARLGEEGRQAVDDYLTELAIYRGELEEADVPDLEARRRRAGEAVAALEDEWRRLEARRWGLGTS